MTAPVTVSGLDRHGVSLMSPLDPAFDETARPLIGSRADRVFKMKPMLVIVRNDAPRTIVALSLTWRVSKRVGGLVHRTNSVFPHVVCGDQTVSRDAAGGPARRGELFGTYVAAKQDWYRTILAGLDAR